jgi:hypothetical protein
MLNSAQNMRELVPNFISLLNRSHEFETSKPWVNLPIAPPLQAAFPRVRRLIIAQALKGRNQNLRIASRVLPVEIRLQPPGHPKCPVSRQTGPGDRSCAAPERLPSIIDLIYAASG